MQKKYFLLIERMLKKKIRVLMKQNVMIPAQPHKILRVRPDAMF